MAVSPGDADNITRGPHPTSLTYVKRAEKSYFGLLGFQVSHLAARIFLALKSLPFAVAASGPPQITALTLARPTVRIMPQMNGLPPVTATVVPDV
jgi:hypothetical protein